MFVQDIWNTNIAFISLSKRNFYKIFRTLPVFDQDGVIVANLNIDHSDSRTDSSNPNDSMKESQCVEEQDYSESTNTEKQNSQNEPDYKLAELTSNGRLKSFLCLKML